MKTTLFLNLQQCIIKHGCYNNIQNNHNIRPFSIHNSYVFKIAYLCNRLSDYLSS